MEGVDSERTEDAEINQLSVGVRLAAGQQQRDQTTPIMVISESGNVETTSLDSQDNRAQALDLTLKYDSDHQLAGPPPAKGAKLEIVSGDSSSVPVIELEDGDMEAVDSPAGEAGNTSSDDIWRVLKYGPCCELWWRHEGMEDLPDDVWRKPQDLTFYTQEEFHELTRDLSITHMVVNGHVPQTLTHIAPTLIHLRIEDAQLLTQEELCSISMFTNLEVLHLIDPFLWRNVTESLPDELFTLTSLRELQLHNIGLKRLHESISQLTNLEVLNLSSNRHLAGHLPDGLFSLTSLRELNLTDIGLKHLPESISQLTNLEKLSLSLNVDLAGHLPHGLFSLTSLRVVDLCNIRLKHLPESISQLTNLEVLSLSYNRDFAGDLPDGLFSLTSLRELHLSDIGLKHLPESMVKMESLEHLDIQRNEFTHLPASVCELKKLRVLKLDWNNHLTALNSQILNMHCLKSLSVAGCRQLKSPPCEVSEQGIADIRQYYTDMAKGRGKSLPFATIAVIGQALAGKTSLVKTLQNVDKKRVLTNRGPDAIDDEATKVFNFEEVDVDDTVLRFIDMGGHEVYHLTYQLTLRQNCVPVIVVSIEQYKKLADAEGPREAVRRLYLDWMSHLYLAHPDLGPPKLVLTHKDKYSEGDFEGIKQQFLTATNALRNAIVHEEKELKTHIFRRIKHLSNANEPIFSKDCIYDIGNEDSYEEFDLLKKSLYKTCQDYVRVLPKLWEEVEEYVQSLTGGYTLLADLFEKLHAILQVERSQLESILRYMHNCGKLLWYETVDGLSLYVFTKIPAVTQLLNVLYDHNTNVWESRVTNFQSALIGGHVVHSEKYQELIESFQETGVMPHILLHHLLQTESIFTSDTDVDVALELLKSFRLIHGPVAREKENVYIIPQFAVGYMDDGFDKRKELNFQVDIIFKGLSLPQYVYNQMTIGLLELFPSELDTPVVKKNGASIFHRNSVISFIHDHKSRKASIKLSTTAENIGNAWLELIAITNNTIEHVLKTWSASRFVCISYCAHCRLINNNHPKKDIDPAWSIPANKHQDEAVWSDLKTAAQMAPKLTSFYTEMEPVVCGTHQDVPSCLKFPCKQLNRKNAGELKKYISMVAAERRRTLTQNIFSKPPPPRDTADSDISDGGGYLYPYDEPRKCNIGLRPRLTSKQHILDLHADISKAYKMSLPIRGRAIVINNNSCGQHSRSGADVDVRNITEMLDGFKFHVSVFDDLTAEGMLSAISKASKHPHHEDYGMFVLVIMSHGTDGDCIYGADYPNAVKLRDVYDLLSAQEFPSMGGKPKLVIIQACSGVRKDQGNQRDSVSDADKAAEKDLLKTLATELNIVQLPSHASAQPALPNQGDPAAEEETKQQLNVDDLLVIKSCFESYSSFRHNELGSLFIRCLVTTFSKHACHRDIWSLCDIIQKRVREQTIKLSKIAPDHGFGQVPVYYKTLTNYRKLYLFPGM